MNAHCFLFKVEAANYSSTQVTYLALVTYVVLHCLLLLHCRVLFRPYFHLPGGISICAYLNLVAGLELPE